MNIFDKKYLILELYWYQEICLSISKSNQNFYLNLATIFLAELSTVFMGFKTQILYLQKFPGEQLVTEIELPYQSYQIKFLKCTLSLF